MGNVKQGLDFVYATSIASVLLELLPATARFARVVFLSGAVSCSTRAFCLPFVVAPVSTIVLSMNVNLAISLTGKTCIEFRMSW